VRRGLAAVAVLAVACGGLLYNQGNGFPCDFSAAEEVRDKACAPTEVCSVLNRCERFVYEGPQFEGVPQLPDFDAGRKVHPLVLNRPVVAVTANANKREEFLVVLASDAGPSRSVSVELGRFVLLKDVALKTDGLREVAVASEGFGATLNATAFPTLFDGTAVPSAAKTLRAGVSTLGLLRARPPNGITAGTLDAQGTLTPLRPVGADGGLQTVIDFRWLPPTRRQAKPFGGSISLTREGFFSIPTDAGSLSLSVDDETSIGLPVGLTEPQPLNVLLRHDLSGALWAFARPERVVLPPTVLSTWELTRQGEIPVSIKRAWNDCTPCPSNARILAIAPNLDDLANVEVLCGNALAGDNGTLVRVVGSLSADASDRCVTQPVTPAFDLSRQTLHTDAVPRGFVIDDANGGGVLVGGQRGEVWVGPSFSRALPLYLERVPLAVGAFSLNPTTQAPLVVTDRYVAAQIFGFGPDGGGLDNGFKVFDFKVISDLALNDDVGLRALVGGSPGWGVLSSGDVARVRVRHEADSGTLLGAGRFFDLSFGPRLLTARGDPAREPFFGEAVTRIDGGVVSLVLTADDSVYLAPSPIESDVPNAQQGLFPQLTPEPGSPIRSFALERTRLGTDGVGRVRGYAVTSRNLFTVMLSGDPARWNATPLLLGSGEPLEVWMDNPRGGLARVGYRDGNVFSLPGGFQLVRPTPGQEPRQVVDYENLGGWPVAYATSGLWVGHYDLINGKLDNKLADGRPGKPMQWRPVTMRDGSAPWMNGSTARPGKLHVLAGTPSRAAPYQQTFRLFLYLDDAVYEVGSMLRTNASAPPN
jgi:hypothetical protein